MTGRAFLLLVLLPIPGKSGDERRDVFAVCERERGRAETRDGEVGIFHLDIEGKGGKHFFSLAISYLQTLGRAWRATTVHPM